jgi:hypothetical protein
LRGGGGVIAVLHQNGKRCNLFSGWMTGKVSGCQPFWIGLGSLVGVSSGLSAKARVTSRLVEICAGLSGETEASSRQFGMRSLFIDVSRSRFGNSSVRGWV